jgi:DNA topoisomerase I
MNVVIVESPTKASTIEKYLGKDYKVVSSVGHIRDLATTGKGGLGIDVDNGFSPSYITIKGKESVIKELKKAAKSSDRVFLATDPDREGEAISWHIAEVLGLAKKDRHRVVFYEITKDSVLKAFNEVRPINEELVESQETRRILDRIMGFKLSKLLQNKIKSKSAGRVQSVALKLIVDLEREIQAFEPVEYWTLQVLFPDVAELKKINGKKAVIDNEAQMNVILKALQPTYTVADVSTKQSKQKAKLPFTTSTLQQEASNKLGYGSKKTMIGAQKLYEGITLKNETVGLITYMRTDSFRLSNEFTSEAKSYIESTFGAKFYKGVQHVKNKNAQEAHEAIRPTSVSRTPESIQKYLSNEEYRLYKLIYERAVASMMTDAVFQVGQTELKNGNYLFQMESRELEFAGYLAVYSYDNVKDKSLATVQVGDVLTPQEIKPEQKFTKPPTRFSEATLIKEMEELGIGRPSTYASTIETLKKRMYVTIDDKRFIPTEQGIETTDKLAEFFTDFINVDYTRLMEEHLDDISEGELKGTEVLTEFYSHFSQTVDTAYQTMEKKAPVPVGRDCPECGHPLVERIGKYGKFVSCQNYPECKFIEKTKKEVVTTGVTCPKCNTGEMVERVAGKGRNKGKTFYACNQFPKCKHIVNDPPTGELCDSCGMLMITHDDEVVCSNKECESNTN